VAPGSRQEIASNSKLTGSISKARGNFARASSLLFPELKLRET